jgi:2-polyprenyl-6-methoxyphenol hydroxylase-like FAD-dependent oxidoreductase
VDPLRVGISGFGIAGGSLAVLLARSGHHVTLFEQAPALGPVGAGFLLQPSGQAILERMGLLAPIAARSEVIEGLRAFTHRGGRLIRLGYPAGKFAYGARRALVFDVVRSAVEGEGVDIELGRRVSSFENDPEGVVPKDEAGASLGVFDLLVGADGARSRLRGLVAPRTPDRQDRYGALWTVGKSDAVRGYLLQITRDTRLLAGLLPLGEGACNFFWGLRVADWETLRTGGFASFRDRVLRLNPRAEEILDQRDDFSAYTFATYRHARPQPLATGRVVLLGDAAHATTPHLGQGANLALLDAASLSRALDEEADLPAAFARYTAERTRSCHYYNRLSGLLSPFFQSDWVPLGWARDLGLDALSRVPLFRRKMESTLAGEARGWID